MKDVLRLLAYARRYLAHLLGAVLLMTGAGAATGMMALLIGPILYKALDVHSPDEPVALYTDPLFHRTLYLGDFFPATWHNVWTMIAFAILGVFLLKGLCDYFGNYLVNYVGFRRRHQPAQHGLRQSAEAGRGVLRIALHGPADVVDHERYRQGATGHLAHPGGFLAAIVLGRFSCRRWSWARTGSWRCSAWWCSHSSSCRPGRSGA